MAQEGRKILSILLIVTSGLFLIGIFIKISFLPIIAGIFSLLLVFSLNFFRDPDRKIPEGNSIIISPADGKVTAVTTINDPDVGENSKLVSIFLNVFNVHANRVPISGKVIYVTHKDGQFVSAFRHDAVDVNEQITTLFDTSIGAVKVKQIAGLIARRILCYAKSGKKMKKGDRLGFIMFGSRTDVIFPPSVNVLVKVGQRVVGTETIIGNFINEK
ncbi:MAG: phosphatidylserine decarboxylase [Planctomycetia bacterium]|nr:phosphatidylserine decarboxylase [Planctomycetia bacterium]